MIFANRSSAVDSFEGKIGPKNLLGLVHNTADFLFQDLRPTLFKETAVFDLTIYAPDRLGFIDVLRAAERASDSVWSSPARADAIVNYFTLCLAAHHSTVATFVPTDVDSKIRGLLWQVVPDADSRRKMLHVAQHACLWDTAPLSSRTNEHSGVGAVSGHNGEQLGVLSGGLGSFLAHGDHASAESAAQSIIDELNREAHEFSFVLEQREMEIELLQLAASLTHNIGDLNQGIGYWSGLETEAPYRISFERESDEKAPSPAVLCDDRWKRPFRTAHLLYRHIMAAEGHRHYPLREVLALRRGRELLLPLSPFLDEWGGKVARSQLLNDEERSEVLAALLSGCKKIPGQVGYYRAIAGLMEGYGGSFESLVRHMPNSARALLKDSTIRQMISIKRLSFESSMRKKVRELLKKVLKS